MKKIFIGLAALLCMASCSTIRRSATTMSVNSTLTSANTAELVVSPQKVRLNDYAPTAKEKRGGYENVKKVAIAKLLQQNGDADVLVEPQFEITMKRRSVKRISVSGYPATYKNFHSERK